MKYDLSLDGGGSKLNALLFDEKFQLIARGRGGGVNSTQNGPAVAEKSIRDALSCIPAEITEVDTVWIVFLGDREMLYRLLNERLKIGRIVNLDEASAGLLAGSGRKYGLLALSGTGSDVFNIPADAPRTVVGAWGPILGDQGSGAWIGLHAARAVVRELNGWGEKTVMTRLILEKYNIVDKPYEFVRVVHSSGAPFSVIASLTPLVGQAAREGDEVALSIIKRAGSLMAAQMNALLERAPAPGEDTITLCGGAWKSHPAMLETFEEEMAKTHPELHAQRPWFEHVVAGAMARALEMGMSSEEAHELFRKNFDKETLL